MRCTHLTYIFSLSQAIAFSMLCAANLGARPVEEDGTGVNKLLKQEADGEQVNRRQLVSNLEELDEATAWHAGLLRVDGKWVAIEDLEGDGALNQYVQKRRELEQDPLHHIKLARWCTQHKLRKQARAHYFAVVARDFNNLEARQALGHINLGGRWFSKDAITKSKQTAVRTLQNLERWTPQIQAIAKLLTSTNARNSNRAFAKLDAINEPSSIPALEMFATNVDDDIAKPLVAKIADFRSREACLALVRVALATSSSDVQQLAVKSIRSYPEETYVPELLDLLATELKVHSNLVVQPTGNLALHLVIGSELRGEKHVKRFSKLANVISRFSSTARASITENQQRERTTYNQLTGGVISQTTEGAVQNAGAGGAHYSAVYVPKEVARATAQNLQAEAAQVKRDVERKNRLAAKRTHAVCALLRSLTREPLEDSPEAWWTWWTERYERLEGEKPVYNYASVDRRNLQFNTHRYDEAHMAYGRDLGKVHVYTIPRCTCLVPGTLVQTARGLRPVEEIEIGDLVVAQDIESGKLDLKPVLLTTVRPPRSTVKIKLEKSEIEATGGHLWWVAGSGWIKARELKPGMQIHSATSTSTIISMEVIETPKQTHNLVVDEYHTYFVGEERLLSYDNTQVAPTLRTVPGYGILAGVGK